MREASESTKSVRIVLDQIAIRFFRARCRCRLIARCTGYYIACYYVTLYNILLLLLLIIIIMMMIIMIRMITMIIVVTHYIIIALFFGVSQLRTVARSVGPQRG